MRRISDASSESSMSSAFSSDYEIEEKSNNKQLFAKFVRDTRSKVEQKTLEINATMQGKLPEWKQRGAIYSSKAKETSIEWSRKGKEAVDRWKKERTVEESSTQQVKNENSIFGMPLEVAVALTKIDKDDIIPAIFKRCIEYLDDVGIHEVGIYRIPGSTITVNKLRSIFDKGSDVDFRNMKPDPHAVGTLLKMYLRELPEPIIPVELNNDYTTEYLKSNNDKTTNADTIPPLTKDLLSTIKAITSKLPVCSLSLLQLLFKHLKRVSDNEKENKMSIMNLGLIFIPTLNMPRTLFHYMIENYPEIFEVKAIRKPPPPPLPQKPSRFTHTKTMSDTTIKVPPPKPSRANLKAVKPRSKSVSVVQDEEVFWKQKGRVEAIGKRFETMIHNNTSTPSTSNKK